MIVLTPGPDMVRVRLFPVGISCRRIDVPLAEQQADHRQSLAKLQVLGPCVIDQIGQPGALEFST